jgi:hypothetical protein
LTDRSRAARHPLPEPEVVHHSQLLSRKPDLQPLAASKGTLRHVTSANVLPNYR